MRMRTEVKVVPVMLGVLAAALLATGCDILRPPPCIGLRAESGNLSFPASGGRGTIQVTAPSGCNWRASTDVTWITIESGATGSGNGSVVFVVAANDGGPRSGNVILHVPTHPLAGGETQMPFRVTQAGAQ
jgi:hypothetical protein